MIFLIIGLTNNPGHFAHIIAYYKMCNSLGYKTCVLTEIEGSQYLPCEVSRVTSIDDLAEPVEIALIYTPSKKNLRIIKSLKKRYRTKIIYVFHEPLKSLESYKRAGYDYLKLLRLALINYYHSFLVRQIDMIFLGSEKALEYYDGNKLYGNKNRVLFPLIYNDSFNNIGESNKQFFSYIGNITPDHSFNEFIAYIKWAWQRKLLEDVRFLIATKSPLVLDSELKEMISEGLLTVQSGRPLTDNEIDHFFNVSLVVWNAYKRTTQSGVLPRAFMFGTPVVLMDYNTTSLTIPKHNCETITDLNDMVQICNAVKNISNRREEYFKNARECFVNNYYWKSQIESFRHHLNLLLGI